MIHFREKKRITLKSVTLDIERYQSQLDKKKAASKKLNAEIKALEAKIKIAMELQKKLTRDQVRDQIETQWLKDRNLSNDELTKLVELGTKLKNKMTDLNIEDVISALDLVSEDKNKVSENNIKEVGKNNVEESKANR